MKRLIIGCFTLVATVGLVLATDFTDLDTLQHQGKTGLKDLVTGIDANFAMLEGGTVDIKANSVTDKRLLYGTTNGYFKVVSTQLVFIVGTTTNIIDADITN